MLASLIILTRLALAMTVQTVTSVAPTLVASAAVSVTVVIKRKVKRSLVKPEEKN
jgi:hypothetical protein